MCIVTVTVTVPRICGRSALTAEWGSQFGRGHHNGSALFFSLQRASFRNKGFYEKIFYGQYFFFQFQPCERRTTYRYTNKKKDLDSTFVGLLCPSNKKSPQFIQRHLTASSPKTGMLWPSVSPFACEVLLHVWTPASSLFVPHDWSTLCLRVRNVHTLPKQAR